MKKICLNKKILDEIIVLAQKNGIKKIFLFGSRARGDNHERSDIDLAISGGNFFQFTDDVENIETLLSFDVVNLDEKLSADFRNEINHDGVLIFEEVSPMLKKYKYFSMALNNLIEGAKIKPPYSMVEQTGIVGLFEICFEQSWKMMKEMLENHSRYTDKIASPRTIIKIAFQHGMIDDEEKWLDLQKTRNILAHTYDADESLAAIEKIRSVYLELFIELKNEVDKNWIVEI